MKLSKYDCKRGGLINSYQQIKTPSMYRDEFYNNTVVEHSVILLKITEWHEVRTHAVEVRTSFLQYKWAPIE